MDIDSSVQTRQVNNYSTPVPNYNFKRAHSGQATHPPNKIQRNFRLNAAYPFEEDMAYDYSNANVENLAQAEIDPNNIFPHNEPVPQHYTFNGDDHYHLVKGEIRTSLNAPVYSRQYPYPMVLRMSGM